MLPARSVRPARTRCWLLVRGSPIAVATKCGASFLWLVAPCICWRVGGTCDFPVEASFPESRKRFELGSSGWSRVLGVDAVGGAPHRDFTNQGGAGMPSRWCPDRRRADPPGVTSDLVGEVGDSVGSLDQVDTPDGMVIQRRWNGWEPGKRPWVSGCGLW